MIRSAFPFVLALGLAMPAVAQEGRPPSLLLHGNYCGPGNNAPRPPIDALDAACARHDACTPGGGLASPACNARLQRDAEAVANDPGQSEELRTLAGFVSAGAAMLPSAPGVGSAPDAAPAAGVSTRRRTAERRNIPTASEGKGE